MREYLRSVSCLVSSSTVRGERSARDPSRPRAPARRGRVTQWGQSVPLGPEDGRRAGRGGPIRRPSRGGVLFMEPAPGRRPVPAAAATRSVCTGQQWGGTGPRTGQVRRRRRRPVTARAVSADSCRRYRLTWLSADHQPATGLAKQRAGSHTAGTLTSGDGDCTADLG